MKTKFSAILLLLILCSAADAALVTIEITAEVDYVQDHGNYLEGNIGLGDIITGTYTYDSTTPDSNPSQNGGRYEHYTAPCGITLTSGGFQFATDPANTDFVLEITNDYPPNDDYFIISYNNLPLSNGTLVDSISWWLHDPAGTALSTDALPTTAPLLTNWASDRLRLDGERGGYMVDAHVTSAVPEPATLLLLAIGGLLLIRKQR